MWCLSVFQRFLPPPKPRRTVELIPSLPGHRRWLSLTIQTNGLDLHDPAGRRRRRGVHLARSERRWLGLVRMTDLKREKHIKEEKNDEEAESFVFSSVLRSSSWGTNFDATSMGRQMEEIGSSSCSSSHPNRRVGRPKKTGGLCRSCAEKITKQWSLAPGLFPDAGLCPEPHPVVIQCEWRMTHRIRIDMQNSV